jgi:hypothetical protein
MIFAKTLFWVVIVTATKRELSEVKLKCLTHHFRTKYLFTQDDHGILKPYFFHAKEVKTSLIL